MLSRSFVFLFYLAASVVVTQAAPAGEAKQKNPPTYTLRYQFEPDQTLRWEVVHRSELKATVSGTTQTTQTRSRSIKLWRVESVAPDGAATFVQQVEDVDMWHRMTGPDRQDEARYNSQKDAKPPRVFRQAAQRVGKPLCRITISPQGKILKRKTLVKDAPAPNPGEITVPLPAEPVPVGHTWSERHEWSIPLETGGVTKILARQTFTLAGVKTGVATIEVATQVLTPIHDPAIEAKLIERGAEGAIRFDLDAGRVLAQQMDLDNRVVGFRGAGSSLGYVTRYTEKLLPATGGVARRDRK